jgi:hypothetical protein
MRFLSTHQRFLAAVDLPGEEKGSDLLAYQDQSENQEKTLKQVKEEFNRNNPRF